MLQKTWHNRVTTAIPGSVDPVHVVSILHDHGFLITMSPIVTRYEKAAASSSGSSTETQENDTASGGAGAGAGAGTDIGTGTGTGEKIHYDVWENIGVLPAGLMKKEITFKCAFENRDDGVVSWIQAPMGLHSRAAYSVKLAEGDEGGWVLDERIESSCSLFLKTFVEKTMVSTRKEMHGRIVDKAREREAS